VLTYVGLRIIPGAIDQVEKTKIRVEIIKTGVTAVAGAVGLAVFWLGIRRQLLAERTQSEVERAQQVSEYDASERRTTELYMKAADQLDSEKAAVRLAGLYAFERLAQSDPRHRQTIVEVLCAFLRMPFAPPPYRKATAATTSDIVNAIASGASVSLSEMLQRQPSETDEAQYENQEVRMAAQRILQRNLQQDGGWEGVAIDLSGASLVDFDFSGVRVAGARFSDSRFHGRTSFSGAHFNGPSDFTGSVFDCPQEFEAPSFDGAVFTQEARFTQSFSTKGWSFRGATFHENLRFFNSYLESGDFEGAEFYKGTNFSHGGFGTANFSKAKFHQPGGFGLVEFRLAASFEDAEFVGPAEIGLIFHGGVSFKGAKFRDSVYFHGTVRGHIDFEGVVYPAGTDFSKIRLEGQNGAITYPRDRFPIGWRLVQGQNSWAQLAKAE
jgi:uncharacterized protein YjbI with pentapeptide repeats